MRLLLKRLACLLVLAASAYGQSDSAQPNVATQLADMLAHAANGHTPAPEEIQSIESSPGLADGAVASAAAPLLTKALANSDPSIRQYALAALIGMQSLPDPTPPPVTLSKGAPQPVPIAPAAYKSAVASALEPIVSQVGAHLGDDDPSNRMLAATALGGFLPDPPASVIDALLTFLKRDDSIGPVGVSAVSDLLQFSAIPDSAALGIANYLRRSDQTSDTRANLVEAIASKPNQNRIVDKAVVSYLDSDDSSLRARVILSLPPLDLAPDVFLDTRSRIQTIAEGGQEALPVVTAAKTVAACWTAVKMTSGCPN